MNDNPNNPPNTPGVCCPTGTYSQWDSTLDRWVCRPTSECGLDLSNFGEHCEFDFGLLNRTSWVGAVYTNDPDNWCNSQVPNLYSPSLTPNPRSAGCCLVQKYGAWDYYVDESNIKIYG